MRTALITGGAGFIGSHLAEALLDQGWRILVIDDLSTGRIQNIEHLLDAPTFSFVHDSALDEDVMTRLVEQADVVYHLAAVVGVSLVVEQPVRTIETNTRTTEMVLRLCAERRDISVLVTSSSEAYGKLDNALFSEESDLVLGPTSRARWCYASSKIIDELLAKAYHKEMGLHVVIARLFNTIGPRQSAEYGMVVPRLVRQALLDEPLTVFGDGKQRRSFTWIGDAVGALTALMADERAAGEVFNIGSEEDISIYDLALLVKRITDSRSEIVLVPYQDAYAEGFEDMPRRLPDLQKIRRLFDFRPTLGLGQCLERIVADTEAQLAAEGARSTPDRADESEG